MVEEVKALAKNETLELVTSPLGKKPIGCQWVFTVKHMANGLVERYKARFEAKGFTHTYGLNYQDTFAPIAKMNTIRITLSSATNLDWDLQQFDVKNAFLHGDLEEELYMKIPPGFDDKKTKRKVCRLKKAVYGLKQSPKAWFNRLNKAIISFGYHQSNADHTLFIKHGSDKITSLIVYVDDIVATGDDKEEIARLRKLLAPAFEIKDLGQL
ncbi:Cysteine-rich RLK (RECEPTOR-like protein kinase) 8, putative [Theobroma cacao]|uniref:Cysteine-rich RLK (RECEPTOR-like protein kinase) 8, putative n=1 Tax=Theobroma cacao TaxID=3641 RepID=A0A061GBV0_THECC|nr:Cysteine-rich RLK (RECEPTOR-like protein kinase) 8, putative [Theobroma cacao]